MSFGKGVKAKGVTGLTDQAQVPRQPVGKGGGQGGERRFPKRNEGVVTTGSWKGRQVGTTLGFSFGWRAGLSPSSLSLSLTSAWLHPSGRPLCLQSPGSFLWFPTGLPKKVAPVRSGGPPILAQPNLPRGILKEGGEGKLLVCVCEL